MIALISVLRTAVTWRGTLCRPQWRQTKEVEFIVNGCKAEVVGFTYEPEMLVKGSEGKITVLLEVPE